MGHAIWSNNVPKDSELSSKRQWFRDARSIRDMGDKFEDLLEIESVCLNAKRQLHTFK